MLLPALFLCFSCGRNEVDKNLFGVWVAGETGIAVRVEPSFMKFEFTQGKADSHLNINEDLTVTGSIGGAIVQYGNIAPNGGILPDRITGVSYRIRCDLKGHIFSNDPLPEKEVQLWILSGDHADSFRAELRYTDNGAQFPMGEFVFLRDGD